MAAKATTTTITVNLKLENGTTSSGKVKTIIQPLGQINKDAMDIDKAYAIALLLAVCLEKEIYAVEQTVKSDITDAA